MSTQVNYGNILTELMMSEVELGYVLDTISNLNSDGTIVEWGAGASTCKWIESLKDNQRLISIEHNESWYNRVQRAIKAHFSNNNISDMYSLHYIPEAGIEHTYSTAMEEHPIGTDKYINPPIDNIWNADVYIIDGIARGACCMSILYNNRHKSPIIFLKDYVGRELWYSWATQFFNTEVIGETTCKLTFK